MTNPLITRLRLLTGLSEDDLQGLAGVTTAPQPVPAHADIVPEGRPLNRLHVVLEGWAGRYKILSDGRRQIPALLLPGDVCDLDGLLLRRVHCAVVALTPCVVVTLPHDGLWELMNRRPTIRDAFWWLTFVENAVATEWTVCVGRRSADERLAHLLCELLVRLWTVGLAVDNACPFPLTQVDLADALGLSTVHVNRTLQDLRGRGLISLEGRRLTIHAWDELKRLSGFSADYLHVEGLRGEPSAARR